MFTYRNYIELFGDSDQEYDRNYSPTPPPHSPITPGDSLVHFIIMIILYRTIPGTSTQQMSLFVSVCWHVFLKSSCIALLLIEQLVVMIITIYTMYKTTITMLDCSLVQLTLVMLLIVYIIIKSVLT